VPSGEEPAQEETQVLRPAPSSRAPGDVLRAVYAALEEAGYDPLAQLVGYLLSGDPAYITSRRQARALIRSVGREELLEELVRRYLQPREGDR
jgi:uncharacterized protein (UPF0297 family)